MGKQSVTVRGKAWERKNSLWIIWSFFACAGVGFLMTGKKIKEKKWIIIGIAYLIALWGGFGILGSLGEGTAAEAVGIILDIIYIGSIVHCFIVKNEYLKRLDLVMNEQEINLEQERIQREKEKLEMQKKLDAERLQREKEMQDSEEKTFEEKNIKTQNVNLDEKQNTNIETVNYDKKKMIAIWGIVVVVIIVAITIFSNSGSDGNLSIELDDYRSGLISQGITPAESNNNWSSWSKLDDGGFSCMYKHSSDCHIYIYADDDKIINKIAVPEEAICPSNKSYGIFRAAEAGEALFLVKFVSAIKNVDEQEVAQAILSCINSGDHGTEEVEGMTLTYYEELEYQCGAIVIE